MENQTVRLELNINMVNVVLAALAKLPLEQSIDTFMTIRQQVNTQVQADTPPEGPLSDKVVK